MAMERGIAGNVGGKATSTYSDGEVSDSTSEELTSTPKPAAAQREVENGCCDATSSENDHEGGGAGSVVSTSSAGTRAVYADLSSSKLAGEKRDVNGADHRSVTPEDPRRHSGGDSSPQVIVAGIGSPLTLHSVQRKGVLGERGKSTLDVDLGQDQGATYGRHGREVQTMEVDIAVKNQSSKPRPSLAGRPPLPPKPPVAPIFGRESRLRIGGSGFQGPPPLPQPITSPLLPRIDGARHPVTAPVPKGSNSDLFFPMQDLGFEGMGIWQDELPDMGMFRNVGTQPGAVQPSVQEMLAHLAAGLHVGSPRDSKTMGSLVTAFDPKGKGKQIVEYPPDDYIDCDSVDYLSDEEELDDGIAEDGEFGLHVGSPRDSKTMGSLVTASDPKGKGKQIVEYPADDYIDCDSVDYLSDEEELDDGIAEDDYSAIAALLREGQETQIIEANFPERDQAPPKGVGRQEIMETLGDNFDGGSIHIDKSSEADPIYLGGCESDNERLRAKKHFQVKTWDDSRPKRQRLMTKEERLVEINSQWKDRMRKLGTPYQTRHPSADELRKSRKEDCSDDCAPEAENGDKGKNPESK